MNIKQPQYTFSALALAVVVGLREGEAAEKAGSMKSRQNCPSCSETAGEWAHSAPSLVP